MQWNVHMYTSALVWARFNGESYDLAFVYAFDLPVALCRNRGKEMSEFASAAPNGRSEKYIHFIDKFVPVDKF